MLTQLETVRARLAIVVNDYDDLLTNAIKAVSARFDKECNRFFEFAVDDAYEFPADQTEIIVPRYPINILTSLSVKTSDAGGYESVGDDIEYLTRNSCIITLSRPLGTCRQLGRLTYCGGYAVPGGDPGPPPLPDDLEQAAVEQVAAWFLHRDMVGLEINWPKGGVYQRFSQLPLLPSVEATLSRYKRWSI